MDKWSISQVILSEVSLCELRLCSRMLCGCEIVMWETVKNKIIELIECSDMCEQKSRNELAFIQDQFGQLGRLTRNWFSGLNSFISARVPTWIKLANMIFSKDKSWSTNILETFEVKLIIIFILWSVTNKCIKEFLSKLIKKKTLKTKNSYFKCNKWTWASCSMKNWLSI